MRVRVDYDLRIEFSRRLEFAVFFEKIFYYANGHTIYVHTTAVTSSYRVYYETSYPNASTGSYMCKKKINVYIYTYNTRVFMNFFSICSIPCGQHYFSENPCVLPNTARDIDMI